MKLSFICEAAITSMLRAFLLPYQCVSGSNPNLMTSILGFNFKIMGGVGGVIGHKRSRMAGVILGCVGPIVRCEESMLRPGQDARGQGAVVQLCTSVCVDPPLRREVFLPHYGGLPHPAPLPAPHRVATARFLNSSTRRRKENPVSLWLGVNITFPALTDSY